MVTICKPASCGPTAFASPHCWPVLVNGPSVAQPAPSLAFTSPAFAAALFFAIFGGSFSRRHIGDGQRRAMDRQRAMYPPTPATPDVSRQVRRALERQAAKKARRA